MNWRFCQAKDDLCDAHLASNSMYVPSRNKIISADKNMSHSLSVHTKISTVIKDSDQWKITREE